MPYKALTDDLLVGAFILKTTANEPLKAESGPYPIGTVIGRFMINRVVL
jgi:hypothetical protein